MYKFFIFILVGAITFLCSPITAEDNEYQILREQIQRLQERLDIIEREKQEEIRLLQDKVEQLQQEISSPITSDSNRIDDMEQHIASLEEFAREQKKKSYFGAFWKSGLYFQSQDKVFKLGIGGRFFVDFGFVDEDSAIRDVFRIEDFAQFRTARLKVYGTIYEHYIFKAETIFSWVDRENADTEIFWGYYVYLSYFITGEHRKYKTSNGYFVRVKPKSDFLNGGFGAWEVGIRYSKLDLNDDDTRGRRLDDFTFGVNWYLNPHVRIMANYIYFLINNLDNSDLTDAHAFILRFQVDW